MAAATLTGDAFSRSIDQAATSRRGVVHRQAEAVEPGAARVDAHRRALRRVRLDRPQLRGALRHPAVGEQLHALAVRGGGVGAGRDGGRGVRRRPARRGGLCRGRGEAEGAGGDRDRRQAVEAHSGHDSSWIAAPTSAPCRRARVVPDRSVARRAPRARPRRGRGTTPRPRSRSSGTIRSSQPREPPVRAAEQRHHRGHEQAAHERRVDRHGDAHADAELLDRRVAVDDEREEDADHDQRRRGDDAARVRDAVDDRLRVVARALARPP